MSEIESEETHEARDSMVGKVLAGRYKVLRKLGAGGMGAVYEANQISMNRNVALKLILGGMGDKPEAVKRFEREMQATAKIEHANTIRVYDFGRTEEGALFLAMEFLDGKTLTKAINDGGPMPLARVVRIGSQIARALSAAHKEGIVHRDLKPDNVMLLDQYEEDFVKVLDFGIARFLDDSREQLTADGAVIGTPAYLSPEQAKGTGIDHRSDLYSLGVILYQMATGKVPFTGPTPMSLLVMHMMNEPPPPTTVAPGLVDPALEKLILELLAKDPANRPQTATDVASRLEDCVQATTATVGHSPPPPPPPRAGLFIGIAVAGAVALGGGFIAATQLGGAKAERAKLDQALAAEGDPVAPSDCMTRDKATLVALAKAVALLHGGGATAARPEDEQALALIEEHPPKAPDKKESAEYFALLARARQAAGRAPDKVLEPAERATLLCPDYAYAFNVAGNASQRAGKSKDAADRYERASQLAAGYAAPRFNLGLIALRDGNAAAAVTAFAEVAKRNPDHPNIFLVLGQAEMTLGKMTDAAAHLEEAARRKPDKADIWLLLGQVRQAAGMDSAKEAFCKAKALGNAEGMKYCDK